MTELLSISQVSMMINDNDFFQQLKNNTYAEVPLAINSLMIQDSMDAFFQFLKEPDSVKNHIDFSIAPNHRRGDVGFKHRKAEDHVYNDSKEFFHFHPALLEKYTDFLSTQPVLNAFFAKASLIWTIAYDAIRTILLRFDKNFPGTVNKVFAAKQPHILLRFLKYDWQQSGKYLAKPHFDAGSCTLAIAESCPGLRIGKGPETLQLVEHKKNHGIFMLSSNYRQLLPTEEFSPGWHDVVQLDASQIGKPFARWALVAFIEAEGVEALPREETHKWFKMPS